MVCEHAQRDSRGYTARHRGLGSLSWSVFQSLRFSARTRRVSERAISSTCTTVHERDSDGVVQLSFLPVTVHRRKGKEGDQERAPTANNAGPRQLGGRGNQGASQTFPRNNNARVKRIKNNTNGIQRLAVGRIPPWGHHVPKSHRSGARPPAQ